MEIKELGANTWSELDPQYAPDHDVLSKQQKIHLDSCLSFSFPRVLKSSFDESNNNYSTFALTSSLNISDSFTIDVPQQAGKGFVTTLSNGIDAILNTSKRYCRILSSPLQNYLDIGSNFFFGERNPDFYFEIDFLSNNTCRVSHNYYNIKYYLNYNFLNNKVVFLSGTDDIDSENTVYKQQFEYIYDEDQKLISFFYRKNNNVYVLTRTLSSVSFLPLTGSNIDYTYNNVFHVNPIKFNLLNSLSAFWFEYTKQFDTNNLNVNCTVKEIDENQLIFHSEFNNISSSKMPFNVLGQKNSLTPFSKNVSSADNKKQRKYVSLNTGSRQKTGNIKFSSNYQNEYAEYVFSPERITYFHTPVTMGSYALININDTDLIESGAIYHNTPEFSDKVWKKMSDYKLTSKFGDPYGEINGTWLCSWLSGSSSPDVQPIWYDRYFVPGSSSKEQAFSASNVYTYESHYDCVTEQASQPVEIFDVRSELSFDPYTLYAYYRTGKKDILNLVKQNKNNLLFEQINQYLDVNGTVLAPNESDEYIFQGNQYGSCDTINSKNFNNQFTICFSVFSEDFSKPFGHELMGNYKNRGLGIYSDRSVSPFVRIIDGSNLMIYDAKMNFLDKIKFQRPLIQIVQLESVDDYFILDNSGELFQLDSKNTIFDSTFYGLLSSTISHYSDDTYTHFLISVSGDVVSYNRKTENIGYNSFPRNMAVSPMSAAKDVKRVGDSLYIVDGIQAQMYEPSRIFYLKNGEILEWNLFADLVETRFFNSSGTIVTYKIDENNNFYIFDHNSTCHIHNSAGFVVTDIVLPISSSKVIHSDYGKMYSDGKKIETIYAVCSGIDSNLLVDINPKNLTVFGSTIYTLNHSLTGGKISGIVNSNYNKEVLNVEYPNHTFSVRIGLPNLYAYNDFDEINLKFDARQLGYGYHEVALSFDSVKGTAFLIVDGRIVNSKTFSPAKYSFSEIISEPLSFGSTQFFAGTELFQKIKNIKNAFLVSNITMRDVFFFTKSLNYYEIRTIQRLSKNIKNINFILPSENRNYTDTVQQFFRQRLPYHKSQFIDVSINNSQITNASAQNYIQQQLNLVLMNNLPYYTKINKLIWRENL
jgi:hypothetical protein